MQAGSYLIEGNGHEARQTSKEQTKMPNYMLEGPQPLTIFCVVVMNYVTAKKFLLVCSSVRGE